MDIQYFQYFTEHVQLLISVFTRRWRMSNKRHLRVFCSFVVLFLLCLTLVATPITRFIDALANPQTTVEPISARFLKRIKFVFG